MRSRREAAPSKTAVVGAGRVAATQAPQAIQASA
jgi:hypothetical protein